MFDYAIWIKFKVISDYIIYKHVLVKFKKNNSDLYHFLTSLYRITSWLKVIFVVDMDGARKGLIEVTLSLNINSSTDYIFRSLYLFYVNCIWCCIKRFSSLKKNRFSLLNILYAIYFVCAFSTTTGDSLEVIFFSRFYSELIFLRLCLLWKSISTKFLGGG